LNFNKRIKIEFMDPLIEELNSLKFRNIHKVCM